MGFFDKLFGGKSKDENTAKFTNQSKTVLTPLQGKVLAQADIPDETFAQGILGPGCGIEPTGDTVYAPFDGTVTQIATTLHAVGITSNDGIELLIHVGMDTVDMKGQGFTVLVKENQKVGNLQVKASTKGEVAKGYRITDVIVTPPVATVTAPISYFDKNKAIELDPIDVTGASKDVVQTVNVPAPLGGSVAVPQVTVTIKIEKD